MDGKRFNEILEKLLEKDNSVETADLLNELKNGYNDSEQSQQKITELENNYKQLEQKYINTFKSSLNTPVESKEEPKIEESEPIEATTTFEDIFK